MLPNQRTHCANTSWVIYPETQSVSDMTIFKIEHLANSWSIKMLFIKTSVSHCSFYFLDNLGRRNSKTCIEKYRIITSRYGLTAYNFHPVFHQFTIGDQYFFAKTCHNCGMPPLHLNNLTKHIVKL